MKDWIARRVTRMGLLALVGIILVATGGCPVDTDTVVTETVSAALTAVVATLVDSLSQYLAGN